MTCLYPNCAAIDEEKRNKLTPSFNFPFDQTDDVLECSHVW